VVLRPLPKVLPIEPSSGRGPLAPTYRYTRFSHLPEIPEPPLSSRIPWLQRCFSPGVAPPRLAERRTRISSTLRDTGLARIPEPRTDQDVTVSVEKVAAPAGHPQGNLCGSLHRPKTPSSRNLARSATGRLSTQKKRDPQGALRAELFPDPRARDPHTGAHASTCRPPEAARSSLFLSRMPSCAPSAAADGPRRHLDDRRGVAARPHGNTQMRHVTPERGLGAIVEPEPLVALPLDPRGELDHQLDLLLVPDGRDTEKVLDVENPMRESP